MIINHNQDNKKDISSVLMFLSLPIHFSGNYISSPAALGPAGPKEPFDLFLFLESFQRSFGCKKSNTRDISIDL
jgi:hypothetical protein